MFYFGQIQCRVVGTFGIDTKFIFWRTSIVLDYNFSRLQSLSKPIFNIKKVSFIV